MKFVKTQSINAIPEAPAPVFPAGAPGQASADRRKAGSVRTGFLGILMLETHFPRPRGDIGHPDSFPVPTRRLIVHGASAGKVVQRAPVLGSSGLLAHFIAAARRLEAEGASSITTSCGFLVLFQREIQAAVQVPVVTSSLLMLPGLLESRPRVGLLTISSERLDREYLEAAGVPRDRAADVIVQGVEPHGEFVSAILGDRPQMDFAMAESEVIEAAATLKQRAPELDTVVLECTNLPPYAAGIQQATGMRCVSLLDCETLLRPFA